MGNKYTIHYGMGAIGSKHVFIKYAGDSLLMALFHFFTIKIDKKKVYWKSLERR